VQVITDAQAKNIQGIGIAGFRKDHQQLIFIRIDDPRKVLQLLQELSHRTSSAWEVKQFNELFSELRHRQNHDPDALEVVWVGTLVSASGYRKLDVNLDELPGGPGSDAFKAGMAARAGQIGDTREKDSPAQWVEEFRPGAGVDMLIVVAGDDPDDVDEVCATLHNDISEHGCISAFDERGETLAGHLRGHEHFGFKDGVSQPAIADWDPAPKPGEPPAVPLGEFVLGYADAAGQTAAVADLWADGSFAVFRRLQQDVFGFRQQVNAGVPGSDPALDAATTAAKLVGRWPSGSSIETSPQADDHNPSNAFGYAQDADGLNVPRFAHVRKANPRDEQRVDLADQPTERHRMLRRGAPFGRPLPSGATADDGEDRGLHFLSVIADIDRQFEFVQRQWLNDPNFPNGAVPSAPGSGYGPPPTPGQPGDGPDPITGEFDAGAQDALRQPPPGVVHQFPLMHEIVTVTAGEYFYVPSVQALKRLGEGARASDAQASAIDAESETETETSGSPSPTAAAPTPTAATEGS
jgi:Dyp-type peroxidase family